MSKPLRMPIGIDIFGELFEKKYDFVDKSLFIKAIMDDPAKVLAITRPRRFGKTLNLSMLHHFFAAEAFGFKTQGIFDNLKIAACGDEYMQHQGKYPVIFITLKDVKDHKFKTAYGNLTNLLANTYREHRYLQSSEHLSTEDKQKFTQVLMEEINESQVSSALYNLSYYLYQHYGVKAWLLIDEYDSPIHSAYLHSYYDEMIALIRNVFGITLKTNPYLEKAVLTGILRVAKESLFSGLNNVEVYTLLNNNYGEFFGFTDDEVQSLFHRAGLDHDLAAVRHWYNGYQVGDTVIYNPWSIIHCIKQKGALEPYWINTSSNDLIYHLLKRSSGDLKMLFDELLQGRTIQIRIDQSVVFPQLETNDGAVWSLFLMTGYLKVIGSHREDVDLICELAIPNNEVRGFYRSIIGDWLGGQGGIMWYNTFLEHLLTGDLTAFSRELKQVMENIVSSHDTARDPEVFYHGLIIGLTASLYKNPKYELHSNRESGYGRYDYLILSRDPKRPTLLLELKRIEAVKDPAQLERNLERAAHDALQQIETHRYLAEAQQKSPSSILKIGLAFSGKYFKLQSA